MDIRAEIYNFSHDMYGNPTAHYTLWKDGEVIYKTGRRDQCGYGSDRADAALVRLRKLVGEDIELSSYEGRRGDGCISAYFDKKECK